MKYKYSLLLLFGFIIFFLVYNPFNLYFLSDDFDSVLKVQQNNYILHSFRPLSDISIKTDHLLWGKNASGFHFTNILFHLLSTAVLFVFSKQLYRLKFNQSETNQYAFFTAIFFLFYPYHSETLFWIVGRGGSLCTLMALLSLRFYLKKTQGFKYYFLSVLFFIAGALSYESIWILPLVITALSLIIPEKKDLKKELKPVVIFWLIFFFFLLFRFFLTKQILGSPYGTLAVLSTDNFSKIKNFVVLITRSFVPPAKSLALFIFYFFVLFSCLLFVIFKLKNKSNAILKISIPCFLICLLPVISFGIDSHDTEGERFLYLPSVFVSITFITTLVALFKKQFIFIIGLIILAEACLLFYNYRSYEAASKMTAQTVKAFSSLKNKNTLYCINLPSQFRGAYIFRNGFESAIKLYTAVKNVNVLSKIEVQNRPFQSYKISYNPLEKAVKFALIDPDKIKSDAVVFYWKQDQIEVYK